MKVYRIAILCFCLLCLGSMVSADESQQIVRAKIGIQVRSGDEIRRAAALEHVKAGDRLRIYLISEPETAYIYVIHANQDAVARLNDNEEQYQIAGGVPVTLPSMDRDTFYTIDGASPQESITVICSPVQLPEVETLLQSDDLSYERWLELEQTLIEQNHIDLRDQIEKPWIIAGGVRSVDPFLTELQIFSGKSLVVRKYEFRVTE